MATALTPNQAMVLAALIRHADAGQPCPTNDRLCGLLGLTSSSSASEAIKRLEARGLIIVTRGQNDRVVQIVETGRCTAGEVTRPHWRLDPSPPPKRRYVQREPTVPAKFASAEDLITRIEADQQRLRDARLNWLELERQRYRLPRRGRMIEEMVA